MVWSLDTFLEMCKPDGSKSNQTNYSSSIIFKFKGGKGGITVMLLPSGEETQLVRPFLQEVRPSFLSRTRGPIGSKQFIRNLLKQ